jgi:hypothetical protein
MRPILDIRSAKVTVELTSRCNLRCGMCPMGRLGRPEEDMPWWLIEKVAADFDDNGIRAQWLHEMGEPLLHPRLAEAIDLFPGTSVSTNVTRLDEARARELLATSLRRIRLCVDTVDPTVYPKLRNGGDFDGVVANISRFLELSAGHDIEVEIQRMVTRQTAHESKRSFVDFFDLNRYPQARVIEKTCEGLDTADETEFHQAYYGCFQGYPFRYFIVLSDGRVTHCCYDYDGSQPIGDMKTQTVREILADNRVDRYMTAFRERDWNTLPRCGECHRNSSARTEIADQLQRIGHRIDRVLPIKEIARKVINR